MPILKSGSHASVTGRLPCSSSVDRSSMGSPEPISYIIPKEEVFKSVFTTLRSCLSDAIGVQIFKNFAFRQPLTCYMEFLKDFIKTIFSRPKKLSHVWNSGVYKDIKICNV